jgi:hypothetical protein
MIFRKIGGFSGFFATAGSLGEPGNRRFSPFQTGGERFSIFLKEVLKSGSGLAVR